MAWQLVLAKEFERSIRKLDKPDIRRIKTYLDQVVQLDNPRDRGKALTADKVGLWRYRVGNFRVLVKFEDQQMQVIALDVGHRSTIYR
ncbi:MULTISPECIES: type II toxin-antitoxin system RelE family toxin [Rothia]|uniref:type II toxin-antitoxin system RelE family toxin n=1 Tax=Rothia TaxID=32207 RepID=UPI0024B88D4A|nr:type II toxin-antitoxin system RelE/ParE family toxin [Rothia sp. SD9660Na]WHS50252.1 type II toxin-antitoxin system RelE/ParE family toxin [Rothia sp. SD9660Na]